MTQAVEPCYIDQCELSANGLDSSQLMPCPKSSAWSASLPLGSGHHVCQSKLIEPDLALCQERPPRVEEVGSGGQVSIIIIIMHSHSFQDTELKLAGRLRTTSKRSWRGY